LHGCCCSSSTGHSCTHDDWIATVIGEKSPLHTRPGSERKRQGMSRKIFLPRPEERNFSCLPAPVRYARCSVVLSCPLSLGSCNCSISAAASLLVATTPISL